MLSIALFAVAVEYTLQDTHTVLTEELTKLTNKAPGASL